jgi:transcriptional regulator with XRE-family HTH domain
MPLDHDQQRLKDLGERLFGAEFHGKLARLSLVSRSYISQIVRGDRPVTPAVENAITAGIRREVKRLRDALRAYENPEDK